MAQSVLTIHNELVELRVQAQVFVGRALIDTRLLDPGEIHFLWAELQRYDMFFKNGSTGWELARRLDCEFTIVTLRHEKGRYVVVGSRE